MTGKELESYASAFRETGLSFAKITASNGFNRDGLEELPWEVAIVHIIRVTGWAMVDDRGTGEETPVIPLRLVTSEGDGNGND
jgi:hypothetical protein